MIQVRSRIEDSEAQPQTSCSKSPDVVFMPAWKKENPYQELLADSIQSLGLRVGFSHYPRGLLPLWKVVRRHPELQVLHLHWIAPYVARILWSRSNLIAYVRLWLMVMDLILVRFRGVTIVWTVHNRLSHESMNERRELRARRWLARLVHRLVFHSSEAREDVEQLLGLSLHKRSVIIPHGHYIGRYPDNPHREMELKEQFGLCHNDVVVLFFGAIRRYKGVSQLLEAFRHTSNERLKLIIAGKPTEPDLAEEILTAVRCDPRIKPYLDFVPDHDVGPLYAISHIAAIPFERTLTSGSAILALSHGKALLLPKVAKVFGLSDTSGTIYFTDTSDLSSILENVGQRDLDVMGRINQQLAKELDWHTIAQNTVAVYSRHSSALRQQHTTPH